ncbi:hypothetical protein AeMF1_017683 [Aphanomyces euteiches]|nr:hypothetical protein AeMF1_017683 [Aphanomyces euteiches]
MASALLGTSMAFFDTNPLGRIFNRYSQDTATIDTRLASTYDLFVSSVFSILGSFLTSIVVIQWASLLFVPILYIAFQLCRLYLRPSRQLVRLVNVTASPVLTLLSDVEQGCVVLRAFGVKYIQLVETQIARRIDVHHRMKFASSVLDQWFDLWIQLQGSAIVMIVAVSLVVFRSVLSAGMVGLAFNYILMTDDSIVYLIKWYSSLEMDMIAPERVLSYCELENEDLNSTNKAPFKVTEGAIQFKRVQLRYKPTGELVLRDLSFSIRGGEKIGIVGRTGAGKSSLTMALFRMYPISSGSIWTDGRNVWTVSKQELRRQLCIIPQAPVLFKGTLRHIVVCRVKGGVEQLVSAMPEKLSTELAEKGSNLSVSERQMLCLARALLVQSKIVVLDEATAAMDHETDVQLQRVITTEFADSTVLTIAHRLHTVVHSDRIMVMDGGRVVEMDTPSALLAKEDGAFFRFASQGSMLKS